MHPCTRLWLRPNLRLHLHWLHLLKLASLVGSKASSAAHPPQCQLPLQRLAHPRLRRRTANQKSANPVMQRAATVGVRVAVRGDLKGVLRVTEVTAGLKAVVIAVAVAAGVTDPSAVIVLLGQIALT